MFIFKNKVSDRELQWPLELLYMRRLRIWLTAVNMWPWNPPGEEKKVPLLLQHKVLFPLWVFSLLSQLQYLCSNQSSLPSLELTKCILTSMLTFVDCSRLTVMWTKWYRDMTKDFVTDFHLLRHRNKSDYAMKIYKQVHRYCTIISNILYVSVALGIPLYNLGPVLTNLYSGMLGFNQERPINGTFAYSIYFGLPFNTDTWLPGYLLVFSMTCVLSYWTCVILFAFDVYLAVVVLHTWGHLKILNHQLRTFPRPAMNNWYTREESEEVLESLKQHIDYHIKIIGFMKKISKAFSPVLGVYLVFLQASGCILLLQCSKLEASSLLEFGGLTTFLFQQLIQISVIFELLGTEVDSVAEAVYMLPWECMGMRERRVALMFLGQAQSAAAHARLKAMGLVPVGVSTMAAIIRTSISYFIMLRTAAV